MSICLLCSSSSLGAEPAVTGELAPERTRWGDFDIFALYAQQSSGGSSNSLGIAWRPELWGEGSWKLQGLFGGGMIYGRRHGGFPSPTLSLRLNGMRAFGNFYGALGAGTETWIGFGGTAFAMDAEFGYQLTGAHLTRIYVSYLPIFFSLFTSEVQLGFGLNF